MSSFKALKGRRILINLPQIEESAIQLTPELQAEMEKEIIKKFNQLEVFAVGEDVKDITAGDKVYVNSSAIAGAERIVIDGEARLLVGDYDVIIVW